MTRRVLLLPFLLLTACSPAAAAAAGDARRWPRCQPSTPTALLADIKKLASDEFAGRGPGSPGEELTVNYLVEQFKAAGAEPGNPDGTWVQKVPLVSLTATNLSPLVVKKGARAQSFTPRDQVVAFSQHVADAVSVKDSEVVFAGYGVQAPEYQWDDFKGLDVKGKTLHRPGQRPAGGRSRRSQRARREDLRRQGHDVLRPLDVQVREGRGAGRGRRVHRARDRAGRVPVQRRARLRRRAVRPGDAGQEHGARGDPGLAVARGRDGPAEDRRAGLPGAEGEGAHARLRAGGARR